MDTLDFFPALSVASITADFRASSDDHKSFEKLEKKEAP